MTHSNRALAQGAAPWPNDETMVELMRELRTYTAVAQACGKRRESLRDYLRVRPQLRGRMSRLAGRHVPVDRGRADLEARRLARRIRHAREGDSAQYELILRGDPCSYCGGPVEVTDHIEAASTGGEHDWSNYTGACVSCNSSKGTQRLLVWLLDHWDGANTYQRGKISA